MAAWPVDALYEALVATTSTVKAALVTAIQVAINGIYGGTLSLKTLCVDGIGGLAVIPPGRVNLAGPLSLGRGAALASASSIAITNSVHHVTGTTQINSIGINNGVGTPIGLYDGQIVILIPDGVWSTGNSGNIYTNATAVVGKPMFFVYDENTAKWYPSYT